MLNQKLLLLLLLPFAVFANSSRQLIPNGSKQIYKIKNIVNLLDLRDSSANFGYETESLLTVASVWNTKQSQLLYFELEVPKLCTRTSKPHKNNDCVSRQSIKLSQLSKSKFYLLTENNKIVNFLTATNDKDIDLINFKKGIASFFQVELTDQPKSEQDISGICNVFYHIKSSTKWTKTKTNCRNWDLKVNFRFEKPLGIGSQSFQDINYETTQDGILNKLTSYESHLRFVEAKPNLGTKIESSIELELQSSDDATQLESKNLETVLSDIKSLENIAIEAEIDGKLNYVQTKLKKLIKSEQSKMINSKIGHLSTSLILAKLLPTARITKTDEFVQILKSPSTQNIQNQLIDLLGATQTIEAHEAFNQVYFFENEDDLEAVERYLQSLAICTRPNEEIFLDLYDNLSEAKIENENLRDTLIQTLSSMAAKYSKYSSKGYNDKSVLKIKNYLLHKLNDCEKPECKSVLIRGLQNLRDPSTINFLINLALKENGIPSVTAMKALRHLPIESFDENNRKDFEKIFYQLGRQFDSTARVLALDIIFEMKPSKEQLVTLVEFLQSNDKSFEIKTYLIQKLRMIAEKCEKFATLIDGIISDQPNVNNYHIMAQKGLTTVLKRNLANAPALNESLISIQEIFGGVLKQGTVDLILSANNMEFSTFKLGLYTSGLGSFVSAGGSEEVVEDDNAPSTAGMEITVQGVHFRPLVFFNGQSELMGHLWSGTASEPTAAYQSTVLQQDHEEYILLQNGATMFFRVLGSKSIDLNGQVQFSLWNRNAHTEINQNSGVAIVGVAEYATSFIQLENNFSTGTEPKMNVVADIDFYSDVKLCIQLGKPNSSLWHKIEKSLKVTDSKYSIQSALNINYKLPGNTMALNQKNNEMCNIIAL